jgi:hypothetical protein
LLRCRSEKAFLAENQNIVNSMPAKKQIKSDKKIAKALKLKRKEKTKKIIIFTTTGFTRNAQTARVR